MRKIMMTLFVILALIVSGSTLTAQTPVTLCGGLSDDDCALLTESQAAMAELESAGFDFALDLTLEDLPDTPQTITMALVGSGGYTVDSDLAALALTQMTAGSFAEAMESLFKSFDTDVDLILSIPEEVAGIGQPNRLGLSMRLVEGFAYFNFDKMAEVLGGTVPGGWQGIDLAGFYRDFFEQQPIPMMPFAPDTATLTEMEDFVTIERVDDDTSGEQTLAVFRYTYDYAALFNSEWFTNLMQMQFANMGMGGQIDEEAFLEAYTEMLSTITLEMTQSVGIDDHYLYNMTFDMNWTLDLDAFAEMTDSPSMGLNPITLRMTITADLNAFNSYPAVEEPADATIIPLSGALLEGV